MPLTAGRHLGHFEITAPIGKGGMGEVYKARDTRLDRTVAIKILPAHLSESPELKERFEPVADALRENAATITEELLAAQGDPVDLGGYFHADPEVCARAMRPSATFNAIIDGM